MEVTAVLPSATSPPSTRPWHNRRVYVRHLPSLAASSRLVAKGIPLRRGRIQDISLGGIALVLRQPLERGTEVLIRVKNEILNISYDLSATVVHARRKEGKIWVIGCEFSRELTGPELETLLV